MNGEQRYTTAQVAKQLNIAPETVRKYNSLFYSHNVRFSKVKGKILYSKRDLELFQRLQKMHTSSKKPLVDCVTEILGVTDGSNVIQLVHETAILPEENQDCLEQRLKRLELAQERLKLENETLRSSIEKSVSERDKTLLQLIRDIQEVKREVAASKANKPWWKFWG